MSKSKQKRDYMLFIEDIVTCIEKIERYTGNVSFEEFGRNDMAVDAVIRNLEIIGEAIKKIPEEIKKKHANVEWKEAAGFRNVLIHDYFGIDVEAVWDTIRNNIPSFKRQIVKVLESEKASERGDKE
ncbi:MAG: DUF86 domain-containing protein [Chloroflexi bacterium CG07_land_8_20_14_0_80_45_17]|nr:MAG: hypothetical protein COX14_02255 [Chloroflexi bacterium CG23_combo_of_CG06-09_8_20_14_all_45_10]PIU55970.1 MAG: DUF86 domain-containing protein [Chloroflexi bacterium CG07_land_8_20_14_0_80_45_17]